TTGPDGNIWFTERRTNAIGRITPDGATISEFSIPSSGGQPLDIQPLDIKVGPDGNLWFTEVSGNKFGRITPLGVITEFPVPTTITGPSFLTEGPDGNLWFTENGSGVVRFSLSPSKSFSATVRVDDGRGGFDTQSFTINVINAAPAEIH